jgi:hypothetical protein
MTVRPYLHYKKRIVATLEPGDVLAMRLERTRESSTVRLPLSSLYTTALMKKANA